MLNRLITTLRKRGTHGRTFPVQAAEAAQAAELIAGVVAQRDELLEALIELNSVSARGFLYDDPARVKARAAIAKATRGDAV